MRFLRKHQRPQTSLLMLSHSLMKLDGHIEVPRQASRNRKPHLTRDGEIPLVILDVDPSMGHVVGFVHLKQALLRLGHGLAHQVSPQTEPQDWAIPRYVLPNGVFN